MCIYSKQFSNRGCDDFATLLCLMLLLLWLLWQFLTALFKGLIWGASVLVNLSVPWLNCTNMSLLYWDQILWVSSALLDCWLVFLCPTHGFLYTTSQARCVTRGTVRTRSTKVRWRSLTRSFVWWWYTSFGILSWPLWQARSSAGWTFSLFKYHPVCFM